MCRLLLRVPLIERGSSAVTPQSGTVGSYEIRKVRQNGREWRLIRAVVEEDR